MIYVERNAIPQAIANDEFLEREKQKIRDFFNKGRNEFPRESGDDTFRANVMNELRSQFHAKCAYCESKLEEQDQFLSRFRPNREATPKQIKEGDAGRGEENYYYLWLQWEWDNLYLACKVCEDSRWLCFPIENDHRAEPYSTPTEAWSIEKPYHIDPCLQNPLHHLKFEKDGTVHDETKQGCKTIEILQLNRDALVKERQNVAIAIEDDLNIALNGNQGRDKIKAAIQNLAVACKDNQPFAGMKRQLLYRWLKARIESENISKKVLSILNEEILEGEETTLMSQLEWWNTFKPENPVVTSKVENEGEPAVQSPSQKEQEAEEKEPVDLEYKDALGSVQNKANSIDGKPSRPRERDQVFICYSRKDKKWLDELIKFITPYTYRREGMKVWYDEHIKPGCLWDDKIKKELEATKIAVLLYTSNFGSSEYINKKELPYILANAKNGKIKVLWIAFGPGLENDKRLNVYEGVNDFKNPIMKLNVYKREVELTKIAKKIKEAYDSTGM